MHQCAMTLVFMMQDCSPWRVDSDMAVHSWTMADDVQQRWAGERGGGEVATLYGWHHASMLLARAVYMNHGGTGHSVLNY